MKTLILVRHGKSSWDHAGLSDFDRPLSSRGLRDAPKMARRLRHLGAKPDVIISSPARRALATAEIFAEELGLDIDRLHREPRIYEASTGTLLDIVQELHDSWDCVLLVGHNPGFTTLTRALVGAGPDNIPTGAYAIISLDADEWLSVSEGGGQDLVFDFPKNPDPP